MQSNLVLFWILVALTLVSVITNSNAIAANGKWPNGGFLVVSGGFGAGVDVEVVAKPGDLEKLHNNSRCQLPPKLPGSDWWGHATAFIQGHLIICGGSTFDYPDFTSINTTCLKWKPGYNSWMDGPKMWNEAWFHDGFAVTTSLGTWFIDPWFNSRSYLLTDINKDMEPGPHTYTQRRYSCVTHALDDSVVITGGFDSSSWEVLGSVELYDHGMKFSKNLPPLLTPRHDHSCSSTESLLFVAAGWNGFDFLDSVEVLDLTSSTGWTEFPRLPRRVDSAVMVNLLGNLINVGGHFPDDTKENYAKSHQDIYIKTTQSNVFKPAHMGIDKQRETGHSVVQMKEKDFCDEI